jgi:hypothetical protein
MGGGPGETVPHDQAAGVAAGAANLGTQLANSPDIVNNIIHDLTTEGLANNPENFWQALATAGFATMASKSPFALQAIGEGASAGMDAYNKMRQQRAAQMTTAADLAQRQQTYGLEARKENTEEQLTQSEIARNKAYVGYLGNRGDYYEKGGGHGGSAGSLSQIRSVFHDSYMQQHPNATDDEGWQAALHAVSPTTMNARQKVVDQHLAELRANPLPNLPQNAQEQEDLAAQQQLEAERFADNNPQLWAGGAGGGKTESTAATGGMPAGAIQAAPGQPDGKTGGGGKYIAKGGYWYPLQQ